MKEKKDIEKLVLNKFSFLEKQTALSKPQISRETWITRISYLGKENGFDIELDWREFDLVVLVVRLEDGKLPKGYYVSNGIKCRIIIENVLRDKLSISLDEMNKINKKNKQSSFDTMISRIEEYQTLLLEYSQDILSYGNQLFES